MERVRVTREMEHMATGRQSQGRRQEQLLEGTMAAVVLMMMMSFGTRLRRMGLMRSHRTELELRLRVFQDCMNA